MTNIIIKIIIINFYFFTMTHFSVLHIDKKEKKIQTGIKWNVSYTTIRYKMLTVSPKIQFMWTGK